MIFCTIAIMGQVLLYVRLYKAKNLHLEDIDEVESDQLQILEKIENIKTSATLMIDPLNDEVPEMPDKVQQI